MSPLLPALGRKARGLRQAQGLSLQALAERSGLSRRFLIELEAGRANPSFLSLSALARALRTELPELCRLSAAPSPRRIALVGLRGAGKSTVGRALAQRLEIPFVELDQWIQQQAGLTSAQIFELEGIAGFRRREEEALEAWLSRHAEGVLAVAGGLAENDAGWRRLLASCTVVWLRATPQEHWARVLAQGDARPMQGLPDARARLERMWLDREPAYARAHQIVDTSRRSALEVVEDVALRAASQATPDAADA